MPNPLGVLLCCCLIGPALQPQAPPGGAGTAGAPIVLNRSAGLQVLDGELWGTADGYKVRFDADGFEFTPALGRAAPRNFPLTFRLESVGRGAEQAAAVPGVRRHAGLRVEYDRGAVVERYDLGPEAMEQSFVFATRPRGAGDLVVRGRLATDMVVTPEAGGLRFEQPGIGGFHLGAVTGVAADGERVPGQVRYDKGVLELVLPGAFVDRAALPLVLDPLIGIAFGLNLLTQFNDRGPLAAYDLTNDCYLVVWSNVFSASDIDVNGQRISRTGVLLGTRLAIEASTALETEPSVCNVNGRDLFVVVYNRNGDILARSVGAGSGAVSPALLVAGGAANQHSPAVGGDTVNPFALPTGDAVCVFESDAEPAIKAVRIAINLDQTMSVSPTVHTLMSGASGRPSRPRISKGGGAARRHLVVFERQFADKDPWAIAINGSGLPLVPAFQLDAAPGDDLRPEVDGDGTNWVVAWQHRVGANNHDLLARGITIAGSPPALVGAPIQPITAGSPLYDEIMPCVFWTGGSALVGWDYKLPPLFGDTAALASVDPFDCRPCEGTFFPHRAGAGAEGPPFGCSAFSGGGPPDDVLLVWEFITASAPTNADIAAQLWRSADGGVTSLGGGCGSGGTAQATCVRVPNPTFAHRLRGATPNAGTFLLQSLGQESATCGLCRRVPVLGGSVALFVLTDGLGNAAVNVAIPNEPVLRGLVQFEQWLTLRSGGACTGFEVDFSNALRIAVE